MNGDGNCSSVAMEFDCSPSKWQETPSRIGVQENDYMSPVVIARALRNAMVDEWLGDNSDHF